jgi:hypothetical protein
MIERRCRDQAVPAMGQDQGIDGFGVIEFSVMGVQCVLPLRLWFRCPLAYLIM